MKDVDTLLAEIRLYGAYYVSDMVDDPPPVVQAAIDQGLVKEVGVSGFDPTRAFDLTQAGRIRSGLDSPNEPKWRRWLRSLIR